MADACIADFSSLGAGSLSSYDNELTEAPEEEEDFDVLNDETFGDVGGDDFDWEEQHEKFAEVLGSDQNEHQARVVGFHSGEKLYRSQEEYMEQSINQLMVDDEEVEDDPAIVNVRKNRPIPTKQASLDNLFGPSSPPSFLDTEQLMSPTSRNIWGSPLAETKLPPAHVQNIQSLFDFAKSANADSPVSHIHGPHSRSAPMVLPKARTVEEIENSLLQKPQVPHGSEYHKPRVLTAEELERQLRGEAGPPPPHHMEARHPPHLHNGHPLPPAQFNVPPPTLPQNRHVPLPMRPGMSPSMLPVNGRKSPVQSAAVPMGSTPPFRNIPPPINLPPSGSPGRGYSQPIGIPRGMRGHTPHNSPFNSPNAPYGSPQGPYVSPQHRMPPPPMASSVESPHSRNNNNNKYQSPQQHNRGGYQNKERQNRQENRHDQSREHRYYRPPYNQQHGETGGERSNHHRGSRDEDDYAGIMTQKEKDWIIKIQLLQLQTDNPYLDDYYYTSFCLKKKAKEEEKDFSTARDPKLVIPALARIENRSYKPAQFEGSLGRLTTSSVHNPRQIIDLLAKSVSETAATHNIKSKVGKELRKSRQLLMDIEKGYNLLLDIDDLETKILALPEDIRKPLLEERAYRIDLLFHYLLCDGNSAAFMQYMNVRKGRILTTRALPLLDKVQSVGIVSLVCKNLQQLMKTDHAEGKLETLFEPCAKVIEGCNLATIVMFIEDIQQEESQSTSKPFALALQNKFGSSIVCCLLHRGEKIYSTTSPVDMDSKLQNEWCQFVHDFAGIVATVPVESMIPPMVTYPDIYDHLERVINKRLMAVVEDNLRIFTEPALQIES